MNLDLASKPVKCPNCSGVFYETTETYDPGKMTTGKMLRFTEKYGPNGYNWSLPFSEYDMSEGIVCVECGTDMAPSGYLGVDKLILTTPDASERPRIDDQAQVQATIPLEIDEEPEVKENSLTRYLTQKSCPECGGFFTLDEWERHLASHPKEVRELILGKQGPKEEPISPKRVYKGWPKGKKRKAEIPEGEPFKCPMCENEFGNSTDLGYHLSTHNLDGVEQATV